MEIIFQQLLQPAGIVGTLSVISTVVLWGALREAEKAKEKLYERHTKELSRIVGQHHEFAHELERFVEAFNRAQEKRR